MTLSNAEGLARRLHRLAATQEQETALLIGRRGVADSGGDWICWDGRLIPASQEARTRFLAAGVVLRDFLPLSKSVSLSGQAADAP